MSQAPVGIRVAGPADVPLMARYRRAFEAYGAETATPGPEDAPTFEARFARWYADEFAQRTFWLAHDGDETVGLAGLLEYSAMPSPGRPLRRWGYLGNMYVSAPYRNRGVGGQLLAAAVTAAEQRGYTRVVLAPSPRSVPFYRRAGFVDAGPDAGGDRLMVRPAPR